MEWYTLKYVKRIDLMFCWKKKTQNTRKVWEAIDILSTFVMMTGVYICPNSSRDIH